MGTIELLPSQAYSADDFQDEGIIATTFYDIATDVSEFAEAELIVFLNALYAHIKAPIDGEPSTLSDNEAFEILMRTIFENLGYGPEMKAALMQFEGSVRPQALVNAFFDQCGTPEDRSEHQAGQLEKALTTALPQLDI